MLLLKVDIIIIIIIIIFSVWPSGNNVLLDALRHLLVFEVTLTYFKSNLFLLITLIRFFIKYYNSNCFQYECMYFISFHRIIIDVIALIDLLLPKWYRLPSSIFCLCVFLWPSLAHAYFTTLYSPWAVELIRKWIRIECIIIIIIIIIIK
jgi:hypothetical protein